MSNIHPTVIIEKGAKIASDVCIGAYSFIGSKVVLNSEVIIEPYVVIKGNTNIGSRTHIFSFSSIGGLAQSSKKNEKNNCLVIGSDNMIREYVTINVGDSTLDKGITSIGNHCTIMTGTHIAHDCFIGNYVVIANSVILAGHVNLGDYVRLSARVVIHQFCSVGTHAFLGATNIVLVDIIPFGMIVPQDMKLKGLNIRGLKRRGFSRQHISLLNKAYKFLFCFDADTHHTMTFDERTKEAKTKFSGTPLVDELISFIQDSSKRNRGIIKRTVT